jgi:putative membrane protein
MMHSWRGNGIGWGGIVVMFVFMALFWGGVAAVIVALIRNGRANAAGSSVGPPAGPDALTILDERYARGEIDDDEYHRRRAILQTVR